MSWVESSASSSAGPTGACGRHNHVPALTQLRQPRALQQACMQPVDQHIEQPVDEVHAERLAGVVEMADFEDAQQQSGAVGIGMPGVKPILQLRTRGELRRCRGCLRRQRLHL